MATRGRGKSGRLSSKHRLSAIVPDSRTIKAGSHNRTPKKTIHDAVYWARLRRDFRTCDHQYGGAYNTIESSERAEHVKLVADSIQVAEAGYCHWKSRRLDRVARYAGAKKPLE